MVDAGKHMSVTANICIIIYNLVLVMDWKSGAQVSEGP